MNFLGANFLQDDCFRRWALPGLALLLAATSASAGTTNSTTIRQEILPGTRFATEVCIVTAAAPGPTVMIVGGAHGNEPAGAHAAEVISQWSLTHGKLVVVPRANVPALAANKRLTPGLSTNLSNLNRNFPRAGIAEPARGELAEAIWALALEHKPDWMLDLHEGFDFNLVNDKSVGSSVIVTPDAKGKAAADVMLMAVNRTITDAQLKFSRRGPPINASLARAAGEHLRIPGMTLETTSKHPLALRVRQHEVMVHALLHHLGMMAGTIPPESFTELTTAASGKPIRLQVALYRGPGTGGAGPPSLMQRLQQPPESAITQVTPEEIAAGILTNYHIVIFGGGSGSKQAEALGETGRAEVRKFVEKGGGYIGICAGAYLATSGYPWSLGLINARTVSPKWQRGKGSVKVELTDTGRGILGDRPGTFDCLYANGPIVKRDEKADLPAFETLAYFRTELASNGSPVGVMIDSPAIFSAPYRQGQVVCISPHPEQTKGLEDIVPQAINWIAPRVKPTPEKIISRAE
jgi:predicted deacylase